MGRFPLLTACLALFALALADARGEEPLPSANSQGDAMLKAWFEAETSRLESACLADIGTLADWTSRKGEYRRQLLEMLGLDPLPERTELHAQVAGVTEHDEIRVERLHFQSRPGLHVTANLYLPKSHDAPLPAVLYVCGHGPVKKDGVSYGNKVAYQHHGAWFARHGFACLTIDTLQLGEIEGVHHGTHNLGRWWWVSRGYTPAGVEAWNGVRALDYLQSRPEIDGERIGVTGRSGGGAYSWWIAAIDDRIKAAVPVAGITDLRNHVVDGCVEGHCDCMYMLNTYQWDYPLVAALVAPRPLLISNTDDDGIFPLDGVVRTYDKVRKIYELHGARDKLGLSIGPGPHKDTQDLQVPAFRWLARHLKEDETPIDDPAEKLFDPEQLKVFTETPSDEQNTSIDESFVAQPPAIEPPADLESWKTQAAAWRTALLEKSFRAWPKSPGPRDLTPAYSATRDGLNLDAFDFTSQAEIRLRLYIVRRADLERPELIVLNVLDDDGWQEFLAEMRPTFAAELEAEGVGTLPEANNDAHQQARKMFEKFPWVMAYVRHGASVRQPSTPASGSKSRIAAGSTCSVKRWRGCRCSTSAGQRKRFASPGLSSTPLWLQSEGRLSAVTLYASIFEPGITRVDLYRLSPTHRDQMPLLNVNRYLDIPQAVALAAENTRVVIYDNEPDRWSYPSKTAAALGWNKKQFSVRAPP